MPLNLSRESPNPPMEWKYTSKLQKGGALLEDMRQLVRAWQDGPAQDQQLLGLRANILNKATRARLHDVYIRAFLPRFVRGPVPDAWKLVRPLEEANAPVSLVRPVYYWITALAEPLMADFCREVLSGTGTQPGIDTQDVLRWFQSKGCPWSPTVAAKVARGLLAALRDFGLLEGKARKRLAPAPLPTASFAYIAFCLHQRGASGRLLAEHPDWQFFLLSPEEVERRFLLAHQQDLLEYHAAGSVVDIRFPTASLEDYARVVTR